MPRPIPHDDYDPDAEVNAHHERTEYEAWVDKRTAKAMSLLSNGEDPTREGALDDTDGVVLDFRGVGRAEAGRPILGGRAAAAAAGKAGAVRSDADILTAADLTGEIDAADLVALTLKPLAVLVPDLLVEGTALIVAPPKIGKSMLCYQLATEVALTAVGTQGGALLGRPVTGGDVLYLALEDSKLRGQKRLLSALAGRKMPSKRLTVRWDAPTIGQGLEELIVEWLNRHPDAVLVIVDTLGRIRPTGGDNRRNAYDADVQQLAALQGLTRHRSGLVLLIVHHTRKSPDDDFVAEVSGSYGVAGTADTIISLRRRRAKGEAVLSVTSRELPEQELAVTFSGMRWDADENVLVDASAERQAVWSCIREKGPIWPSAVAKLCDLERTSVQHMVDKLVSEGRINKVAKGYVAE